MRKFLTTIFTALAVAFSAAPVFAVDAANDVVLSQRKADNSGFIQRNLAPTASGFWLFDASKVPTSPANLTWIDPVFGVYGTSTNALRGIASTQYSSGTDSAKFLGRKARGTPTVPTVITTGDFLTRWTGSGYDGSNFIESASIVMGSTGTVASTRVPSFIEFQTGTNAAPTVMTAAAKFDSDQGLKFPSTNTAGLQLYNTSDQVTNYERLSLFWSGNQAFIVNNYGGSGSAGRILTLAASSSAGAPTTYSTAIQIANSTANPLFFFSGTSSSTSQISAKFQSANTGTSGTFTAVSIVPTYNQASGTAANTDLQITRTETALGSGNQFLLAGGTAALGNQFTFTNRGILSTYGGIATAGNGVASIQGAGRVTAQTAAAGSVATYTVGASDASFLVSANVRVTTSSAEAFTVTCAYTDEGNTARTITLNFQLVGGTIGTAIAAANGAVPYEGLPIHIRAKSSTSITIATTGTFTGATYNAEGVITKLQ